MGAALPVVPREEEKPLHVRVAEALGCRPMTRHGWLGRECDFPEARSADDLKKLNPFLDERQAEQCAASLRWVCGCVSGPPFPHGSLMHYAAHGMEVEAEVSEYLADYDTDWSATGPLIEKYHIGISYGSAPSWEAGERHPIAPGWWCYWPSPLDGPDDPVATGHYATPLIAVCELILKLKEAGKL